ncbi:hypothetical protein [Algoriphagus sediminis]|uniref:Uncharacterized protein n=1 Tax=Algoriphagus sediminis TaxID=3057113 RepID=A0ABT7YFZ6_9BACT|nr:hypothetical protein [Algoriphagus sediminis]MDN3205260.1 hypothetical protein [Algoriphagus sediminis]
MKNVNRIFAVVFLFALNPLQAQTDKEEKSIVYYHKDIQISLVPFLGTNGVNSGATINDYSFNILGGFSAGTNKLEMAGLFNINRSDVKYAQFAGVFNQVNGKMEGAQFAGVINSTLGSVNGFQAAGVTNFTTGAVEGAQLAGVLNFTTRSVKGFQGAGVMNFAVGSVEGTQLSGVSNFAIGDVKGAQVSGVLNFARKVDGAQVALFNYSDSISGVPVGLLSIVRSGYHTLELSTNEVMPLNLSWRTGVRPFYNILIAGIRPEIDEKVTWSFGYGIGTAPRLGKKTYLNIEATTEQVTKGELFAVNLINKFYLGFEYQITPKIAVFGGPTLNYRVFETNYENHPALFAYGDPKIQYERTYDNGKIGGQLWYGMRAGVRFF